MFPAGWPTFSAKTQKNVKALGFCVNSTFTEITQVQSILEVLWDSDAHFSSDKAVNC